MLVLMKYIPRGEHPAPGFRTGLQLPLYLPSETCIYCLTNKTKKTPTIQLGYGKQNSDQCYNFLF